MFNFFKHKDKEIHKEFTGRFITETEISEMVKSIGKSFIKDDMDEISGMLEDMKKAMNQDGRE